MFCIKHHRCVSKNPTIISTAYRTVSEAASTPKQPDKVEPVELAYASYETTAVGSGPPPLVIMHGLLGSKGNWNSLCKVLLQKTAPQRKIVAVDARNHGDSPHSPKHSYEHLVEDVKQLLKNLKIKRAALLGHSMGGRAMMRFALQYPDLVEKLIVADISPIRTSPNLKTMPSLFEALNKVILPTNVPISTARVTADQQLLKMVNNKGLRSFLLTNLVQKGDGSYSWRINIPALSANFKHIAVFPPAENLQYRGPVLFIGGGASDFIQKADHPHILKLFPSAEFRYIDGAGHWVHSEKPTEFLQICLEFLNRKVTL